MPTPTPTPGSPSTKDTASLPSTRPLADATPNALTTGFVVRENALATDERATVVAQPGARTARLPAAFDHYAVIDLIDDGGMGTVYMVHDTRLKRIVALKTIKVGLNSVTDVERFHREATALAQLNHPNVVAIHGSGTCEHGHYFTMPYLSHGGLSKHLARCAGDPALAVTIMARVARAMAEVHRQGIYHRDLKPSNILLDARDEPLVSDFGLARWHERASNLTQSEAVLGTPAYMAPEQAAGKNKQIDARTDVWALGVTLYELLAQKRPFAGKTLQEVTPHILHDDPPSLKATQLGTDRDLEAIVFKCLRKNPNERFQTADALADELERWLKHEPIQTVPESWPHWAWRKARPHAIGATLLLTTAALLAWSLWVYFRPVPQPPRVDPQGIGTANDLAALRAELQANGKLTLLADNRPPRWARWVPDHAGAYGPAGQHATFSIHSDLRAMLELLPEVPMESYRIRAEIQRDRLHQGTRCGIYVCQKETASLSAREFLVVEFAGNDGDANGRVSVEKVFDSQPELAKGFYHAGALVSQSYSSVPESWQKLRIDVSGSGLQAAINDKELKFVTAKMIDHVSVSLNSQPPNIETTINPYSPGGGVGLFLLSGAFSCRNFTLEPLSPSDEGSN